MAATTITRVTVTDDDGTLTTGTIFNAAFFSSVFASIDDLFKRTTAGDLTLELENTDTTASSDTSFVARVGSGAAGDAYFLATNGVMSWAWGLDNSDSDKFVLAATSVLGSSNVLTITTGGLITFVNTVYINDSANANMTTGLTINQGGADDEIVALKSSDVAHGVTTMAETDTYATFAKAAAATGGLAIKGFAASGVNPVQLWAITSTEDATRSVNANGYFYFDARLISGTGTTNPGADKNNIVFGVNGVARHIFDSDGDSHQDVGTAWTNFDDQDDVALLHALSAGVSRRGDPLKRAFGRYLVKHRRALERLALVTFNDDGHHFINWSRTHMLTIGAVRQLGIELAATKQALAETQRTLARVVA